MCCMTVFSVFVYFGFFFVRRTDGKCSKNPAEIARDSDLQDDLEKLREEGEEVREALSSWR